MPLARVTTPLTPAADVVGALVAEHLQRHSRRSFAFKGGIGGILIPGAGERGEKSAHRRAKSRAGDVDFHRWPVDFQQRALPCSGSRRSGRLRSCRIVQRFRNHDLAHCFRGAVFGQPRAAQAHGQFVLQAQEFAGAAAARAGTGLGG